MSTTTPEQVDAAFRDRIKRAKLMTPEERFLAGPRMFEDGVREIRAAIRGAFPQAPDETVQRLATEVVQIAVRRGVL